MKTFTIAAVILSVLAMPAHGQARRPQTDEKKVKDDRPKVDEKAYKAALERIPEPKEKYDPWAVPSRWNLPRSRSETEGIA